MQTGDLVGGKAEQHAYPLPVKTKLFVWNWVQDNGDNLFWDLGSRK